MGKGASVIHEMTDVEVRAALEMEMWVQYTDAPWQMRRIVKAAHGDRKVPDATFQYLWPAVYRRIRRIKDAAIVDKCLTKMRERGPQHSTLKTEKP